MHFKSLTTATLLVALLVPSSVLGAPVAGSSDSVELEERVTSSSMLHRLISRPLTTTYIRNFKREPFINDLKSPGQFNALKSSRPTSPFRQILGKRDQVQEVEAVERREPALKPLSLNNILRPQPWRTTSIFSNNNNRVKMTRRDLVRGLTTREPSSLNVLNRLRSSRRYPTGIPPPISLRSQARSLAEGDNNELEARQPSTRSAIKTATTSSAPRPWVYGLGRLTATRRDEEEEALDARELKELSPAGLASLTLKNTRVRPAAGLESKRRGDDLGLEMRDPALAARRRLRLSRARRAYVDHED